MVALSLDQDNAGRKILICDVDTQRLILEVALINSDDRLCQVIRVHKLSKVDCELRVKFWTRWSESDLLNVKEKKKNKEISKMNSFHRDRFGIKARRHIVKKKPTYDRLPPAHDRRLKLAKLDFK